MAAAIGLACLGGMTKPADAYSGYYSDVYSRREIGDTMMRRLVSWLLRGRAESRSCKERDRQSEG